MQDKSDWIYSLAWINPHREPPNNLPRKIKEWLGVKPTIEDFKQALPDYELGCGFGLCINFPIKEPKRLKPEVKKLANERRNKTIKKQWLEKNMPLFADHIIEQEKLDWRANQ